MKKFEWNGGEIFFRGGGDSHPQKKVKRKKNWRENYKPLKNREKEPRTPPLKKEKNGENLTLPKKIEEK